MSGLFPEQPVLFYPSIALRYGAEEAILLAVYHDFSRHHGMVDNEGCPYFLARRMEWQRMASFWEEDRIAEVTNSLVTQGAIDAQFNANGSLRIRLVSNNEQALTNTPQPQSLDAETVDKSHPSAQQDGLDSLSQDTLSAFSCSSASSPNTLSLSSSSERDRLQSGSDGLGSSNQGHSNKLVNIGGVNSNATNLTAAHSNAAIPEPDSAEIAGVAINNALNHRPDHQGTLMNRGPAPSFGGSMGWSRTEQVISSQDDLERIFESQEKHKQQLRAIDQNWQPNGTTYQMLSKHSIPAQFVDGLVDEFVCYWAARDKKEVSWDPLFIRLAKKEWVKEQTRQGRIQQQGLQSGSSIEGGFAGEHRYGDGFLGEKGERYQTTTRAEKRGRITEAIMDINNIDW